MVQTDKLSLCYELVICGNIGYTVRQLNKTHLPNNNYLNISPPHSCSKKHTCTTHVLTQTVHLNSNDSIYHDGDGKTESL